ncbi:hypothetical protein K505DRAFT_415376 [Melanomma pulvis-pyrius CBS 109.77]|uniref:Uncharacterized protein n=1 Tax=Melanomma pulvis-pyrius CBS 109.77 TaxID=1314802 RepID=A0A6A6XKC3_9PLEO|nr:hypothetical protein K505DRAFT_415376 [Melanomma pulvis-pyrius CBS 109.77]
MDAWIPILLPYGLSPLHHHIKLTGERVAIPPLGSKRWITPSLKQLSSSSLTNGLSRTVSRATSVARRSKNSPESGKAPLRQKRKGKRKAAANEHVKKAAKKRKGYVGSVRKESAPRSRRDSHPIITVPDLSQNRYGPAAQGHIDRMLSLSGQWSLFTPRRTLNSREEGTQSSSDVQQSGTRIERDSGPATTLRNLKESGWLLRVKQSSPHHFKPASQDISTPTDLRTTSVRDKHAQHKLLLPANKSDLRRQSVAPESKEEVKIKIDFDDLLLIHDTDALSPTPTSLRKHLGEK